MPKAELQSLVKTFLTNDPESSIEEITWAVYATNKKQSHDRCMSSVVALIYDLLDKKKIVQNFNSTIPVFSMSPKLLPPRSSI